MGFKKGDSASSPSGPPLPDHVPVSAPGAPTVALPAAGCYRLSYATTADERYDGTLRVETTTGTCRASGDLYLRDAAAAADPPNDAPAQPADRGAAIPIFPVKKYRYYLRVVQLLPASGSFRLEFEMRRYAPQDVPGGGGTTVSVPRWLNEGTFMALMAPAGDSSGSGFAGDVVNSEGSKAGTLSMGWVSTYLRKAIVELYGVRGCEIPLDNGKGETWSTVFDKVGWDMTYVLADRTLEEPSGESWSAGEAHEAMTAPRDRPSADAEWRYYLLSVRRIDLVIRPAGATPLQLANGERGYMFDKSAADSDKVPRQGAMVASDWQVPNDAKWGVERDQRAGSTVSYFRTGVHEVGHAMGLDHSTTDAGIMTPTETVAAMGTKPGAVPFPNNILWAFSPDDEMRLRHWPDVAVRPGGLPGTGSGAPIITSSQVKSERHRLDVTPVLTAVPLGAPVRIDLNLVNVTETNSVQTPSSVDLKSGVVRGQVFDPSGAVRTFSPLVIVEDEIPFTFLEPGEAVSGSLTLCRGREGALFPLPGDYRVVVNVSWQEEIKDIVVTGEVDVRVTAAVDAAHAEAAQKVLSTPDTLLTLALGGDHLKEGIAAIAAALNNDVLRPHFAYVEAKRLATRFGKRKPDLKAAADLIDETTVMSAAELRKAVTIIKSDARSAV